MPARLNTALLLSLLLGCRPDDPAPVGADTAATATPGDPYDVTVGPYSATIRWTAYGVPHILADDLGSGGFAMGTAYARLAGCVLADQVLYTSSQRAAHLGPGDDDEHVDTDLGWLSLGVRAQAEAGWFELSEELRAALVGYTAGYNSVVAAGELGGGCGGETWAQPITHIDLLTYYLAYGLLGSGGVWVREIGAAQPPSVGGPPPPSPSEDPDDLAPLEWLADPPLGSNGWAIGGDRSSTGRGMLLSNTHFPYFGEKRWHELHLTVPGVVDVYGVSLMGVAFTNVGFNEHLAWTHTVSNTPRFTAYKLELDSADPTRYAYDGDWLDMTSADYSVEVLAEDGSLETVTRTLYRSHYGPMIDAPVVGWSDIMAITFRDANVDNVEMAEMWWRLGTATSLAEFQAAHADVHAIPWVHTMVADAEGTVWYVDSASTPNLSSAAYDAYEDWLAEDVIAELFGQYGVFLLDGSDPVFEWVEVAGTRVPGLVPLSEAPQLERTDYVFNANDNHWLPHAEQPLEGYPAIYGDERTPRTPRTRMNGLYLSQTGADSASGEDGLFTLEELKAAALGAHGSLAVVLLDEVVAACDGAGTVTTDLDGVELSVDLSEACAVLAGWDGTSRVDSVGAHVWREALGSGEYETTDLADAGRLFATGFDPDDPLATPHTLADDDRVREALAQAVGRLDQAGLPLDAALGDVQFQRKETGDVPILGGQYFEGVISVATHMSSTGEALLAEPERAEELNAATDLTAEGYQVNNGNSFVLAVQFTDDGPEAAAILTYSQALDGDSPHHDDQSWVYATEGFREVRFTDAEIQADPELVEELLTLD